MSKQIATNTWKDGLNKDLNPIVTPNTVLTDNLNGTFITYNGNELSLQNDMGNSFSSELSPGFYPIGMSEFGDIIYIVSVNDSETSYVKATLFDGADQSAVINEIITKCEEVPYNVNEQKLYELFNDGYPVYTEFEQTLFTSILQSVAEIENINIDVRSEKKFEIGSFPSLNPSKVEEELDFEDKYRPLHNLLKYTDKGWILSDFSTTALSNYDINHPVTIEVQPSYDGSVNLILTDDKNPPRIINSGFSVLGNGKGKFIKRNQKNHTNLYYESQLDTVSHLVNTSTSFITVDLGEYLTDANGNKTLKTNGVTSGGQLKGGNYTFYFQLGDEDGNKTDILCESGIVSVFKGTPGDPKTVSGAFNNELTDKMVNLTLNGIDTNYSQIYVSYTREYCDLNGFRLVECKQLLEPYKINSSTQTISFSGVENAVDISIEELNIAYYSISAAKAIAQQQNMLFLGNITSVSPNSKILQDLSYKIRVGIHQSEPIGSVNVWNYETSAGSEYYDPQNIYYKLGYWPNEIYRFGVVYIKADGTNTQVFNLKGCNFEEIDEYNDDLKHKINTNVLEKNNEIFLENSGCLDNIYGVFKTPNENILKRGLIQPLYFSFQTKDIVDELKANGIIGYFIVRQKRIPITICQGFGIGVNKTSYIPMIKYGDKYYAESFITNNETNRQLIYDTISINGDVVEQSQGSDTSPIYYLVHYNWKVMFSWLFNYECHKVCIIGPKGENLDAVLYESSEQQASPKDKTETNNAIQLCINQCKAWMSSAYPEETLHFDTIETLRSNATYNTNNCNPDYLYKDAQGNPKINDNRDRLLDDTFAQSKGMGLLSVEAMTNPQIQSILCGTKFILDPTNICETQRNSNMFIGTGYENADKNIYNDVEAKLIYVPGDSPLKYIDNVGFSTQSGDGVNISDFGFLTERNNLQDNDELVRGKFTPFIGAICNENDVSPNILYNIRVPHASDYKLDFINRANNAAEYYAVSDRMELNEGVNVYRGDCFTNTVTIRMHRNFIDSTAPIADKIIKKDAWEKYYKGYDRISPDDQEDTEHEYTHWDEINLTDLNTVALGHWITFKCLSSSNLGLRSEDTTNVSELALLGTPRSFYPLIGATTAIKVPDSELLNDGYNATVSRKRNNIKLNTPYDKSEFTNRIMFSNVSVTDSFTNGYRTFHGASYQDYTKQFGAIMKLLPWGNNLFCVFEHGIAIVPINEKALMQTTTDQTIHIYGHGVLPDQLSIISQDFGTLWPESVIRTPIGIYGIDTVAKKIWRYTDKNGLETLSDLKLQRFLNDNINLDLVRQTTIGITNVKTHYNNYKGDIMFTFYHTNGNSIKKWNLCYNERQALWVTRYSWIPMFSANINNSFYSVKTIPYENRFDLNGIWKHGRTGVDIDFLPTNWYGSQYPFEFEFVVSDPQGIHKIFEDLLIISNNVQPSEIEFEFVGDAYLFNKSKIYHDNLNLYKMSGIDTPYKIDWYTKDLFNTDYFKSLFYNAYVNYDKVLDEYTLVINQKCKNSETYGRRLGNIQYKEDGWYTNIEPLRYNANLKNPKVSVFNESDKFIDAKLRDKWIKIRIKYTGDRLAIVSGVSTFENISYS